jgi:hypothetical protein
MTAAATLMLIAEGLTVLALEVFNVEWECSISHTYSDNQIEDATATLASAFMAKSPRLRTY